MKSKTRSPTRSDEWQQKTRELRKECRRLRAQLDQVTTERDIYLKSLYALTRKPFSFSRKEIDDMEKNPKQLDDILREIDADGA